MASDTLTSPPPSPKDWVDPAAYNEDDFIIEEPDISHLPTEDETPLDSMFQGEQMRLLVEPLKSSWPGRIPGEPFMIGANVGIYATPELPVIVPDVFLTLDVKPDNDFTEKRNRCYFAWVIGKFPEVVIEIVSNKIGGEDAKKLEKYARMRISYYAIFDPLRYLSKKELRLFVLVGAEYVPLEGFWLPAVGLGLRLWEGQHEARAAIWLRWCDKDGNFILTGAERALAEEQRAEAVEGRNRLMAAKLRELGIDPENLH
jgi:Uma2 family endonuclease